MVRPFWIRWVRPGGAVAKSRGTEPRNRELTLVVVVEEQGVRDPGGAVDAGPLP